MAARKAMGAYWLWTAVMAAVYFAMPAWHAVAWCFMGGACVACVIYGALRHHPRRVLPWIFLAVSLALYVFGDTAYYALVVIEGKPNPFPSIADVAYIAMYPMMAIGLYGLTRSGARHRDRIGLLDSLTITAAVALIMWTLIIAPSLNDPSLPLAEKLVSVAYPVGDVLVIAMLIQLVTTTRGTRAVVLLMSGGVCLLGTDIVYGVMQANDIWRGGTAIDLGWIAAYLAMGVAALDPSMVQVTDPRSTTARPTSPRRMLAVGMASMTPPTILLLESCCGQVKNGVVLGVMSMVTFGLIFGRLYEVVAMHRAALGRERVLRRAGVAMVAATELEDVETAVRTAVADLLPAASGHRLLFLKKALVGKDIDSGICYISELGPDLAESLAGFDIALRCPLSVGVDGDTGEIAGGHATSVLILAAHEADLVGLEGTFEVLAAHTAMAVERIGLSSEIYRRRSEEYFRTLVLNMSDVILILADDDHVQYASPSASSLFGVAELAGRDLRDLVDADNWPEARASVTAARAGVTWSAKPATGKPTQGDWSVVRADGGISQVEVSFQDLRRDPTVEGLVLTLRDVTERRRLELELTYQAFHDALTGLANRALFTERMRQAITQGRRSGTVVGVLIVDLDDFKVINDTMGHGLGDQLLVAVGRRLVSTVRSNDTVARLGGDEFAVLVEDAAGVEDVERLAERLMSALAEPVPLDGQIVACAASVGLTTSQETTDDGQELLTRADLALYMAKTSGKGRCAQYEPELHNAIRRRLELRAELDQSLTDGDFILYYQPIVNLGSGKPVGVEALVRWEHPVKGLMAPGQFIDVAEESGLIVPLGSWVLREAVSTIARWRAERPQSHIPYISVNVSVAQFRMPDFVDQVISVLGEFSLPAKYLLLEITESLLLRDDERVWTDLLALRTAGVRVAIDDFGTGYSALSYLRQVPIDVVKIDKSFVETVSISEQQRALVDGIIGLTNTLGLVVVAEGIEQSAERDILCEIGCLLGQGFLFARPMSYGDAIQWMRAAEVAA